MITAFLKKSKAIYKIDPTFHSCPSCKASGTIIRSHSRNLTEKLINKLSFYRHYRCKSCGWRGILSTIKITPTSLLVFLLYLIAISLSAFITYQILKRLL